MNEGFERVASLGELKEGEMLPVTANGQEIVLVKVKENIYAFQALCTHEYAWLDGGWVRADSLEVECPLHGGTFDLRSGQPTALPPTEPIKTFPVRVESDEVFVATGA